MTTDNSPFFEAAKRVPLRGAISTDTLGKFAEPERLKILADACRLDLEQGNHLLAFVDARTHFPADSVILGLDATIQNHLDAAGLDKAAWVLECRYRTNPLDLLQDEAWRMFFFAPHAVVIGGITAVRLSMFGPAGTPIDDILAG